MGRHVRYVREESQLYEESLSESPRQREEKMNGRGDERVDEITLEGESKFSERRRKEISAGRITRLTESTPSNEALAEVLHARRLLDEFLNLGVDGEDDGSLEVSTGELVLDSLDDLDGVFVLDFSTVGA